MKSYSIDVAPRMQLQSFLPELIPVHKFFESNEIPFLDKQSALYNKQKPLAGLRIIHNTHITLSTLLKLEPLVLSGVDLHVTATPSLNVHQDALEFMRDAKIPYIPYQQLKKNRYDIGLDCCAGLFDFIKPRLGNVELTQTGSQRYIHEKVKYPVINVDETYTKTLETFLGTGDGFLRGFLMATQENINDKNFLIFGYGKVGRGVVNALHDYTKQITIVEIEPKLIQQARDRGFKALHIENDRKELLRMLPNIFCVVTATGIHGLISKYFSKSDFYGVAYLANIGSDDEYGNKFLPQDILYNKRPINFSLVEPTRARYLDPIFYLHNLSAEIIYNGDLGPGVHRFPKDIDKEVFLNWHQIHKVQNPLVKELF